MRDLMRSMVSPSRSGISARKPVWKIVTPVCVASTCSHPIGPCSSRTNENVMLKCSRVQRSFKTNIPRGGQYQVYALKGQETQQELPEAGQITVGEDAAAFDLEQQTISSWVTFFGLLGGVGILIYGTWIAPGFGVGDDFIRAIESTLNSPSSETTMLGILVVFAIVHSGLAFLRPYGEDLIGARAYRVMFALISLPLAIAAVVYFINHRYDGTALWNIRGLPFVHEAVWVSSFISFYFLYPSTFNILEVAAVDEPKVHLWETGIIRITRHPQAWGQLLWCLAHTAWIGSSFMVVTSLGLLAHHAFGCWHGDFRLKRKYGDAFEEIKSRTSIVPFAAILDGRQQLPKDYWKEFLRAPYFFLVPFCIGAYLSHPLMQQGAYWLGW